MLKFRITITMLVVALLLLPSIALAQDGPIICGFYGKVTLNGESVEKGTVIKAIVGGETVNETTTGKGLQLADDEYVISVGDNYTGETVSFVVDDNDSPANETATWVAGEFSHLDLNAYTSGCSLTTSSNEGGSVITPGEDIYLYSCGTVVSIVAEASPCYEFTGWEGDSATVNAPGSMSTSILVDGNYTIEAVFAFEWCEWVYDDNANCEIDYPEMIAALMDYLTDKITFGQMIDVLMMYLIS